MRRPGTSYYPLALNVINLTGRFITGVETSSPDVVFPWIFCPAWWVQWSRWTDQTACYWFSSSWMECRFPEAKV